MAIIDKGLEFCDAVSVAHAAGTFLDGSQINLVDVRDIGQGRNMFLVITVDTEIITGGSPGTIRWKLASDDTAAISTTTSTIHLQTAEFVTDDNVAQPFPAGTIIYNGAIPSCATDFSAGTDNQYEQYLGILTVVTTTTVTAGAINAFLTFDQYRTTKTYADAQN